MENQEQHPQSLIQRRVSRRAALKAGGIAAVGLAFSKPLIQTIYPQPAFAQLSGTSNANSVSSPNITPGPAKYWGNIQSAPLQVNYTGQPQPIFGIPHSNRFNDIAITSDGKKAFLPGTDGTNNIVVVYDLDTFEVIRTISHPYFGPNNGSNGTKYLWAVAITPDDSQVYVSGGNNGVIFIIDANTYEFVRTYIYGSARATAFTPDGSTAYVLNSGFRNIHPIGERDMYAIDTATLKYRAKIDLFNGTPSSIVMRPDGKILFVGHRRVPGKISVVDTASNKLLTTIHVDCEGIDITPDGSQLYCCSKLTNEVIVIDTTTYSVAKTIPVGINPINVRITADGCAALVTNEEAGQRDSGRDSTTRIDISEMRVHARRIPAFYAPYIGKSAASPDGSRYYCLETSSYSSPGGVIAVIDTSELCS